MAYATANTDLFIQIENFEYCLYIVVKYCSTDENDGWCTTFCKNITIFSNEFYHRK